MSFLPAEVQAHTQNNQVPKNSIHLYDTLFDTLKRNYITDHMRRMSDTDFKDLLTQEFSIPPKTQDSFTELVEHLMGITELFNEATDSVVNPDLNAYTLVAHLEELKDFSLYIEVQRGIQQYHSLLSNYRVVFNTGYQSLSGIECTFNECHIKHFNHTIHSMVSTLIQHAFFISTQYTSSFNPSTLPGNMQSNHPAFSSPTIQCVIIAANNAVKMYKIWDTFKRENILPRLYKNINLQDLRVIAEYMQYTIIKSIIDCQMLLSLIPQSITNLQKYADWLATVTPAISLWGFTDPFNLATQLTNLSFEDLVDTFHLSYQQVILRVVNQVEQYKRNSPYPESVHLYNLLSTPIKRVAPKAWSILCNDESISFKGTSHLKLPEPHTGRFNTENLLYHTLVSRLLQHTDRFIEGYHTARTKKDIWLMESFSTEDRQYWEQSKSTAGEFISQEDMPFCFVKNPANPANPANPVIIDMQITRIARKSPTKDNLPKVLPTQGYALAPKYYPHVAIPIFSYVDIQDQYSLILFPHRATAQHILKAYAYPHLNTLAPIPPRLQPLTALDTERNQELLRVIMQDSIKIKLINTKQYDSEENQVHVFIAGTQPNNDTSHTRSKPLRVNYVSLYDFLSIEETSNRRYHPMNMVLQVPVTNPSIKSNTDVFIDRLIRLSTKPIN